jgi:ribosomal protein S18 acetylase RimI-like enzyme
MTAVDTAALHNPAWASLHGAHARFAQINGLAARYDPDVAPFHALADPSDPQAWSDLAELVGPVDEVAVAGGPERPFPGWMITHRVAGVQLIDVALREAPDPGAEILHPGDVSEMSALVARNRPGPFRPRTIELGTYLGIRRDEKLVAMAGERLHPGGWTEISAVCTEAAYRGRGLATRLVRAIAAGIRARGETPFLHTGAANTTAIRLYESIGFELRKQILFGTYRLL